MNIQSHNGETNDSNNKKRKVDQNSKCHRITKPTNEEKQRVQRLTLSSIVSLIQESIQQPTIYAIDIGEKAEPTHSHTDTHKL